MGELVTYYVRFVMRVATRSSWNRPSFRQQASSGPAGSLGSEFDDLIPQGAKR